MDEKKRLRTLKELQKISHNPRYMDGFYNPNEDNIYVRFGQFYAGNCYAVVVCEWADKLHDGDEAWMVLKGFEGDEFEYEPCDRNLPDCYFKRFFFTPSSFSWPDHNVQPKFNARLMREVLNVFQINGIAPNMVTDGSKFEFSGHNDDVSIQAIVMGMR